MQTETKKITCHLANLKKAILELISEQTKNDRFIADKDAIVGRTVICNYKLLKEDKEKPRKNPKSRRAPIVIPAGSIFRKVIFMDNMLSTYEMPDGKVLVYDKNQNGRCFENWIKAYRGMTWAFAMESEAIPMGLNGSFGKSYFDKNSFIGDTRWT